MIVRLKLIVFCKDMLRGIVFLIRTFENFESIEKISNLLEDIKVQGIMHNNWDINHRGY